MKKILVNLTVLIIAVLITLLLGELTIRLLYRNIANYNMEMWRYASDLKKPLENERLPFHHYPNREGYYYGAQIRTNSMGFRSGEIAVAKPGDVKRILVLGDSFTLGWGVPFGETYSVILEKYLNRQGNRSEVVNLGVGNYNSIMELELFKWKGLALNPDLVILMYYINDTEPTPTKTTSLKYRLLKHPYLVAFIFDRYIKLMPTMNKKYEWKKYYSDLYDKASPALAANREALTELVGLCKTRNIPLLIANIPEMRILKEYPFPFATDFIRDIAQAGQVPFLDLLPELANEEVSTLWVTPEDPHANSKANAIIAKALYQKLMSEPSLLK